MLEGTNYLRERHMIRTLTVLFILVAVSANAVDVPFDPTRGLVEVDVTINGMAKGRFGIDTGADRLYVDRAFAQRHNLPEAAPSETRQVVGIDGTSSITSLSLRSLEIGGERLYNLWANGADLAKLSHGGAANRPDGLLGYDVLRRFYITVDYPAHRLSMRMSEPPFLHDSGLVTVPFRLAKHLIVVDVSINDMTTVPMILDYCASHTTITPTLARRTGFSDEVGGRIKVGEMSLGSSVSSESVHGVVADLSQIQKLAGRSDLGGILGGSFLHRHKITVDYKRRKVYFHPIEF